jgi:hypothetical protein
MSSQSSTQVTSMAPLQPSGKWLVQFAHPDCLLSRAYGSGKDQVTLLLAPGLLGGEGTLRLVYPGSKAQIYGGGKGVISLTPGRPLPETPFTAWPTKVGARLVVYWVEADGMARLARAEAIQVPVENGKSYHLATPRLGAALDALETCAQDHLKQLGVDAVALGIDKAARAKVAVPARAKLPLTEIIRYSDYPAEAILNEEHGTVGIAWWIGIDGKVMDCRVLLPSPFASLNRLSCDLIRGRARYEPARDAFGKPIVSVEATRIVWQLPVPLRRVRQANPAPPL